MARGESVEILWTGQRTYPWKSPKRWRHKELQLVFKKTKSEHNGGTPEAQVPPVASERHSHGHEADRIGRHTHAQRQTSKETQGKPTTK